jgi:hypothetical protein
MVELVAVLDPAVLVVPITAGKQPPECKDGAILVEAELHLERTSVTTSAKGGDTRTIYAAVIDNLISSDWYIGD